MCWLRMGKYSRSHPIGRVRAFNHAQRESRGFKMLGFGDDDDLVARFFLSSCMHTCIHTTLQSFFGGGLGVLLLRFWFFPLGLQWFCE